MNIKIRRMESWDVEQVVQGWNSSLPYDRLDERRLTDVILKDPNYEHENSLVAVHDEKIVGFISAVAREGVSGADGKGGAHESDRGYIKGFFVLEEFRRQGIGTKLLDAAADYIRSKGKASIWVIIYNGSYFFPGVDLRYEPAIKFFENKGFRRDHVIDDVDLDLTDFRITDYQKDARRRMAEFGVHVEDYDPSMLDKMKEFVQKVNMVGWFPEGWERRFKDRGGKVVAFRDGEIIGWASFGPRPGTAYFGPIAVLKEMRGNGVGSCLLLESVLRMKDAGAERVLASWANTPFYLPNGWTICRQYAVFEKSIADKENSD